MNIITLIPARAGSKGIKNKNIILFNKKPLISHTILISKKSNLISDTYVWTNSKKIANISKKFGAKVPLLRPEKISEDKSLDIEVMKHFYNWYLKNFRKKIDLIVHLRATSPFRKIKFINKAIRLMIKNKSYSSLRSFKISRVTPFKMWKKNKNKAVPLLQTKKELHSFGRQFLPKIYIHAGYIDILRPERTIMKNSMVGNKTFFYEINNKEKYIDIDTKKDLQ